MSAPLLVASALWLLGAAIHGVLGGRKILGPVNASDLGLLVRRTNEVAWHAITWFFLVLGGLGVFVATTGESVEAYALLSAVSAGGLAVLFVGLGLRRFGSPWPMPQWVIFGIITLASLGAFVPTSFIGPDLAHAARVAAAILLVTIGLLHVAWALGSPFPARTRPDLARLVVGAELPGNVMPGRVATLFVAVALVVAAAAVVALGSAGGVVASGLRLVAMVLVAVFGLRGIVGFFEVAIRPAIRDTPYMTWSRRLYSPLSLLIAVLIGVGTRG